MVDTRARILDVAVELFAEVGYDKAGIRELAGRLGVTSAALYYHFRNKEEILTALAEGVCAEIERLLDEAEAEPVSPERGQLVLARYLDIVLARAGVMTVLESSIATLRGLEVGRRMSVAMEGLSALIAVDASPEAGFRAELALSLLTTPPRRGAGLTARLRPHLLAAAYGALERPVAGPHT